MKIFISWCFCSIFWIIFALSGASAEQVAGPQMVLTENEFDAQTVKEGEIIKHTFSILNKGSGILEIEKVQPG